MEGGTLQSKSMDHALRIALGAKAPEIAVVEIGSFQSPG